MNTTVVKFMGSTLKDLSSEFSVQEQPEFMDDVDTLQRRFVMVHGTDCCWDRDTSEFIKCSHLRLSAPNSFPIWHKSPSREIIEARKIVFDPEGKQGNGIINMFTGFETKPKAGDVEPLLEHLQLLCGTDDVYDWVIKWTAYPLQHPGAKMATALVFHGKEGTGKNIFWDAVKAVYGRWGTMITQSQIESEFNAWMSAKLFILANEVLSRRERRHIKGRLKALVTESTVMINQKNMPIRDEENHANFVFLSNETDPIDTDRHDRRYQIINCEYVCSKEYYRDLKASVDIGALYHYLINLNLGDFNPHTPPILNDAKENLLRLNMRSEQLFLEEWMDGESTAFPFQDVPSLSLYWGYRCWCEERGEKYPCTETRFGRAIKDAGLLKSRANITASDRKVMMIWAKGERPSVTDLELDDFKTLVNSEKGKYKL
ncbi:MAG: DUF5906 domain-containing protein [Methylobacter sp.]